MLNSEIILVFNVTLVSYRDLNLQNDVNTRLFNYFYFNLQHAV